MGENKIDKFDDNSIMFFGRHVGKELANVPAQYLLWWLGMQGDRQLYGTSARLKEYILENMDVLMKEETEGIKRHDEKEEDTSSRKYR